jgi:hypothetical protein
MADFIITDTLANALLAYLQAQRWADVDKLIHELAQIKPAPKKEEKIKPVE